MSDELYGVKIPSPQTLRKYGLSLNDWATIVEASVESGETPASPDVWRCPVCHTTPPSGRTVIDHFHVRGWKQMVPSERRKYVRGVVCTTCNHFILTRYGTPDKFRGAAVYLERYERRHP